MPASVSVISAAGAARVAAGTCARRSTAEDEMVSDEEEDDEEEEDGLDGEEGREAEVVAFAASLGTVVCM